MGMITFKNSKITFLFILFSLLVYSPCVAQEYKITDLGTLGGVSSRAIDINNSSQVVGRAYPSSGSYEHAFLWENGVMKDLGTLSDAPASYAYGINESGQVVGHSNNRAFLWENGVMSDLGTLGGDSIEARDINESGQVVGRADIASYYYDHAFLWENGVMTDLNDLLPADSGWELTYASGINDAGKIIGYGNYNGLTVGYMMEPHVIPEPSTILMLLFWIFSMLGIRKKQKLVSK